MTFRYAWKRSIPVMAGYIVLGMGFGMLLGAKGYGVFWAIAMSVFIYAGSMQYVAIDLITGGASLGGAYDTYGQCAAFILRDLHGGTVQRYETV